MKSEFDFSQLKADVPASIVVFLVAVPLCLGIALASGAPLFSGLIAGMVGGTVVGLLSGSALGVSGPAAGLTVIVLAAIQDLGSFEAFLLAVALMGVVQIVMGYLRTGVIAYYFPSSVIQGMLAGIGVIIILKQIPHAFGYDAVPEGDYRFQQDDNENTFSELFNVMDKVSEGPMLIAAVSFAILLLWETRLIKQFKIFQLIQGPLVAVVVGALMNLAFRGVEGLSLVASQVVQIPVAESVDAFFSNFRSPDFSQLTNPQVYVTAVLLAVVGSLETLLCVEASDKQDSRKRLTPTDRELKAQGVGNLLSGLVGGLPVTQVIVRSSVNVQAGAQTKLSAILHGLIILLAIVLIPGLLNLIPLATLAAVLVVVGYKLAKPSLFAQKWRQGYKQFVPFFATIAGIVLTDLLVGIGIGLTVSIVFVLYQNYKIPFLVWEDDGKSEDDIILSLPADVSFFKKAALMKVLSELPEGRRVVIDASNNYYLHQDVLELIEDFVEAAPERNITVELRELYDHKDLDPDFRFAVETPVRG